MVAIGKEFHLTYLDHEDEAQLTGVRFKIVSESKVLVESTFTSPEYVVPGQVIDRDAARKVWSTLLKLGTYEPTNPSPAVESPAEPVESTGLNDIPGGYYAINDKRYYVRHGKEGSKWEGCLFLSTGSDYHESRKLAMVTSKGYFSRSSSEAGREALLEIAKDPKAAMIAYGKITGTCGKCGRKLEDPESVAAGIGPVCVKSL